MIDDTVSAFSEILSVPYRPGGGPLEGLTFAAKENYQFEGRIASNGNPVWKATHDPAERTARCLRTVLEAGASLVGFTHMDELAYSVIGANAHTGTPVNSAAPDRVPGGSSSGSASAVAAGLVDFTLGSDTGGSVRVPASFCGLYGLRTSHGRIDSQGLLPLAASYDVPGWFARKLEVMVRVSGVYGIPAESGRLPGRLWMPETVWAGVAAPVVESLRPALAKLEARLGPADTTPLPEPVLEDWFETFRVHQAAEVWQAVGDWVSSVSAEFGPGVGQRLKTASATTEESFTAAVRRRSAIRRSMDAMMTEDTVLVLPSAPGAAPLLTASQQDLEAYRHATMCLTCIAGLNGYPELSVPGARVEGAPVGLSLVGARMRDEDLLVLAEVL
ncbi:amidase [Roseibium marinum]|uniref:Amidase n=1 Tax=Roseibium marinum TaxID=281252 RepID=A0A2S3V0X6_9HYPH|nr:amidase [Roseibium marinum]POF33608.1 amidase [Roseibium marinum]